MSDDAVTVIAPGGNSSSGIRWWVDGKGNGGGQRSGDSGVNLSLYPEIQAAVVLAAQLA